MSPKLERLEPSSTLDKKMKMKKKTMVRQSPQSLLPTSPSHFHGDRLLWAKVGGVGVGLGLGPRRKPEMASQSQIPLQEAETIDQVSSWHCFSASTNKIVVVVTHRVVGNGHNDYPYSSRHEVWMQDVRDGGRRVMSSFLEADFRSHI